MHVDQPQTAKSLAFAVLCTITMGSTGCSTVQVQYSDGTTEYMARGEFSDYVESVFRLHNRILNELIGATSLLDLEMLDAEDPLVRAEDAMNQACLPLNSVVQATIEGRELGLFEKLALPSAVPRCEQKTREVEALLQSIQT